MKQSLLDDLTWLYLESAAYALELPRRPVLAELRRAHADYFFGIQYKLSRQEWMAKNQLVYSMQADPLAAGTGPGRTPVLTPYESRAGGGPGPGNTAQARGTESQPCWPLYPRKFALFDGTVHQKGWHCTCILEGLLASLATKTHAHPDDQDRPR